MTDHTPGAPQRKSVPITEDYLRRLEAGELVPTPEELAILEHVYGMTPIQQRFTRLLYHVETHGPAPIPDIVVTDEHRRRVDAHSPNPAAVLDRRWNILYTNDAYPRVLQGVDAEGDNFLDWLFLEEAARSVVVDFAAEARHLVGRFRFVCAAHRDDPEIIELLQRCSGNQLFATTWDQGTTYLADGPAATSMHWHDPETDKTLRVSEEPFPDTEWLTLQFAVPCV